MHSESHPLYHTHYHTITITHTITHSSPTAAGHLAVLSLLGSARWHRRSREHAALHDQQLLGHCLLALLARTFISRCKVFVYIVPVHLCLCICACAFYYALYVYCLTATLNGTLPSIVHSTMRSMYTGQLPLSTALYHPSTIHLPPIHTTLPPTTPTNRRRSTSGSSGTCTCRWAAAAIPSATPALCSPLWRCGTSCRHGCLPGAPWCR